MKVARIRELGLQIHVELNVDTCLYFSNDYKRQGER